MTASEAFTETLVAQGVTDIFGIVGSAFMDALDLFPEAGSMNRMPLTWLMGTQEQVGNMVYVQLRTDLVCTCFVIYFRHV